MTTYNIIARIDVRRALRFSPELTPQALQRGLAGAAVKAWNGDPYNQVAFTVQLKRPTHGEALSEIREFIGQYAFYIAEATVTEIAGDAVEAAVVAALGDGAFVPALASVAAGFTEAVASEQINKIRRDYEARQHSDGSWSLTRLRQQLPSSVGPRPGFSPA
jgi:hypothetical protein